MQSFPTAFCHVLGRFVGRASSWYGLLFFEVTSGIQKAASLGFGGLGGAFLKVQNDQFRDSAVDEVMMFVKFESCMYGLFTIRCRTTSNAHAASPFCLTVPCFRNVQHLTSQLLENKMLSKPSGIEPLQSLPLFSASNPSPLRLLSLMFDVALRCVGPHLPLRSVHWLFKQVSWQFWQEFEEKKGSLGGMFFL